MEKETVGEDVKKKNGIVTVKGYNEKERKT